MLCSAITLGGRWQKYDLRFLQPSSCNRRLSIENVHRPAALRVSQHLQPVQDPCPRCSVHPQRIPEMSFRKPSMFSKALPKTADIRHQTPTEVSIFHSMQTQCARFAIIGYSFFHSLRGALRRLYMDQGQSDVHPKNIFVAPRGKSPRTRSSFSPMISPQYRSGLRWMPPKDS